MAEAALLHAHMSRVDVMWNYYIYLPLPHPVSYVPSVTMIYIA